MPGGKFQLAPEAVGGEDVAVDLLKVRTCDMKGINPGLTPLLQLPTYIVGTCSPD